MSEMYEVTYVVTGKVCIDADSELEAERRTMRNLDHQYPSGWGHRVESVVQVGVPSRLPSESTNGVKDE